MSPKHRILVTDDEREALEVIRPFASKIANAQRAFEEAMIFDGRSDPPRPVSFLASLGESAFYLPSFWHAVRLLRIGAALDPSLTAGKLEVGTGDGKRLLAREEARRLARAARCELEFLMKALVVPHRAGRPVGTKRVDDEGRGAAVVREKRKIERNSGEEHGSLRKAEEVVAALEGVTRAAVKQSYMRRRRRILGKP